MNFPVRLVPPGSEGLRQRLERTSEGTRARSPALIKVQQEAGKCDKRDMRERLRSEGCDKFLICDLPQVAPGTCADVRSSPGRRP